MVHFAKNHINRHRKTLTIVGVLVFLAVGIFVFNLSQEPAYSASTGDVYPDGDHTTQFPNSTGASHWGVLDEDPYDPNDYVNTGTSLDNSPGNPVEEFHMTSIAGANNGVSSVTVYFQAYIQGGCQSDCDTIDANIYIDGAYQTPQNFTLTGTDTQYSATFNGSWTGDDDLRIQLTKNSEGTGNPAGRDDDVRIGRVFANVTYHLAPEPRAVSMPSPQGETTATLQGEVDPNNESTTAWFVYGEDPSGGCSGLATQNDTSGNSVIRSGDGFQGYSTNISGLRAATTYYYCALASSLGSGGSAVYSNESPLLSFTTDIAAPIVTTQPKDPSLYPSAELDGRVTPNGLSTDVWFAWDRLEDLGAVPASCGDLTNTTGVQANIGSDNNTYDFLDTISTDPSETYYYCAYAQNSKGTSFGSLNNFTTPAIPPDPVSTEAATSIQTRSATLNGTANPQGESSWGWFRYYTSDPGSCVDSGGTQIPGSPGPGNIDIPGTRNDESFSINIPAGDLQPAITYWYCAFAENTAGQTASGNVEQFTTLTDAPDVSTLPAQNVTSREAEFWARVRPNGEATTVWFKLFQQPLSSPPNCSDPSAYIEPRVPKNSTDDVNAGSGTSFVDVMYQVNDFDFILIPETEYWYCAIAENNKGTTIASNPEYFETPVGNPPTVETITPPAGVQDRSATLRARVNPNNGTTDVWFRYQEDTGSPPASCDSLTQTTPTQVGIAGDDTWHEFSETLTGLSDDTTYYYCAYGSNWDGTRHSTPMDSFSTAVNPVDTNVSGWAWSSTTGWISFSSINCDSNNDGTPDNAYYSACPTSGTIASYGVDIDYVTLVLSGWAWSNGVGWISFDRSVTGPPPPGGGYDPVVDDFTMETGVDCADCIAVVDKDTQEVYGWARAVSACQNNLWDSTAGPDGTGACVDDTASGVSSWESGNNAAGWDGWIRLDNAGSSPGVTINTTPLPDEFSGWSWGGDQSRLNTSVIGWMSSNCSNRSTCADDGGFDYAVFLEDYGGAPTAENLSVSFLRGSPSPVLPAPGQDGVNGTADDGYWSGEEWSCSSNEFFQWDFSDTYPFDSQTAYRLQVSNNSTFSDIQFDSGKVCNSSQSRSVEITSSPTSASGIDPNQCTSDYSGFTTGSLAFFEDRPQNYYWRAMVWDTTNQDSGWVVYDANEDSIPDPFTTSLHSYPRPNFTWTPLEPSSDDETVIFTDTSTASGTTTREWFIPYPTNDPTLYQDGTTNTDLEPRIIFDNAGGKTVRLEITDTDLAVDPNSGSGICWKTGQVNVQLPLPDYDEVNPVGFFEKIKQFFAKINITDYLAKVVKKYV